MLSFEVSECKPLPRSARAVGAAVLCTRAVGAAVRTAALSPSSSASTSASASPAGGMALTSTCPMRSASVLYARAQGLTLVHYSA